MKKVVILLLVLFLGFYLFSDPTGAAGSAKSLVSGAWHGLSGAFHALIQFFKALSH